MGVLAALFQMMARVDLAEKKTLVQVFRNAKEFALQKSGRNAFWAEE